MKRKQAAHSSSPTRKHQRPRTLKQLEERFALLLLLLEHNITKLLHHKRSR